MGRDRSESTPARGVFIYPPQADLVQHGLQPTATGAIMSRRG
jgi:hypothetical protein